MACEEANGDSKQYLDRQEEVGDGAKDFVDFADFLFVFEIDGRVEIWDLLVRAFHNEVVLIINQTRIDFAAVPGRCVKLFQVRGQTLEGPDLRIF